MLHDRVSAPCLVMAACLVMAVLGAMTLIGSPVELRGPSLLLFMAHSLGIIFSLIFLVLSIGLVAVLIQLVQGLLVPGVASPRFVEKITSLVGQQEFGAAFDLARQDQSLLATVLLAGMSRHPDGWQRVRAAAHESLESELGRGHLLVRCLRWISLASFSAGLIGTLVGAIVFLARNPNAKLFAAVESALMPIAVGIGLAMAGLAACFVIESRLAAVIGKTGRISTGLLASMFPDSTGQAPQDSWE